MSLMKDPRRYKISASWVSNGRRWQYFQDETGFGMRLRDALRTWVLFLVKYRTFAKITRKQPQRFYFSETSES